MNVKQKQERNLYKIGKWFKKVSKWKIVVDSGCDYYEWPTPHPEIDFVSVPLTIQVGERIFLDRHDLDIDEMMEVMYQTTEPAVSSCPSPQAFKEAYEGAEQVIAITITGGLSGSHNAARLGKELLLDEHPQAQVHIIDSLSAGGEIDLLVAQLHRLMTQGLSFSEVVAAITAFQERTKLLFVLSKIDNLVKNGRVNKLLGTVVGLLNIRMVGEASREGKLELLHKPRGHKKSVQVAYDELLKSGYQGGRISISHRNNEKFCRDFSEKIRENFPQTEITLLPTSGLCSFYGEEGGLLIGYEVGE